MSDPSKPTIRLGLVLACMAATLALGAAVKAPCLSAAGWTDGHQYTHYCYSDIVPLLGTEQLSGGRLPYLDPCGQTRGQCDEYPVLSMYAMRLTAWVSNGIADFFWANALLLTLAAAVVVTCVYLLVGPRALYVALAPTLFVYAFMNWDLLAVAFATAATLAYVRHRDVWSGALLGLGTAAKFFPALLVIPFVLGRFRERDPDAGIHLAWAAAGSWLIVNVPFAVAAPRGWFEFFRFNAQRPADWDSLWFIVHHRVTGDLYLAATRAVNVGSAALFVVACVLIWRLRKHAAPDFPRWTFGFPVIVAFLLANKVYSPQYGLWLIPWFALVLPNPWLFVAFEAADVAVFLTRFSWFATYDGFNGVSIGAFELAVVVRAAVLVLCVAAWVRAPSAAEADQPSIAVAATA